jgi:hypothetical protein
MDSIQRTFLAGSIENQCPSPLHPTFKVASLSLDSPHSLQSKSTTLDCSLIQQVGARWSAAASDDSRQTALPH